MEIPIVIVDDNDVDRYLAKRHLSRLGDAVRVEEFASGDGFLDQLFGAGAHGSPDETARLVLMDINMPGLDGFATIEEAQRRIAEGRGPESIVFMMFTSSNNSMDKARAEAIPIVKGFITKPIDGSTAARIRDVYLAERSAGGIRPGKG